MPFAILIQLIYRFQRNATNFGEKQKRYLTMPASQFTIGTHDGCFHCDEALACYMLKLLPRYKDATIIRLDNSPSINIITLHPCIYP